MCVTLCRGNSANRVPVMKESERLVKITEIYHRSFSTLVCQLVLLKLYDRAFYQKY